MIEDRSETIGLNHEEVVLGHRDGVVVDNRFIFKFSSEEQERMNGRMGINRRLKIITGVDEEVIVGIRPRAGVRASYAVIVSEDGDVKTTEVTLQRDLASVTVGPYKLNPKWKIMPGINPGDMIKVEVESPHKAVLIPANGVDTLELVRGLAALRAGLVNLAPAQDESQL